MVLHQLKGKRCCSFYWEGKCLQLSDKKGEMLGRNAQLTEFDLYSTIGMPDKAGGSQQNKAKRHIVTETAWRVVMWVPYCYVSDEKREDVIAACQK